eukprot:2868175-Rhodomonas_salina.1
MAWLRAARGPSRVPPVPYIPSRPPLKSITYNLLLKTSEGTNKMQSRTISCHLVLSCINIVREIPESHRIRHNSNCAPPKTYITDVTDITEITVQPMCPFEAVQIYSA